MMTKMPIPVKGHGLLTGRNVLITAAAGTGIGSAVARRCVEEGANVLVSDSHERRLEEIASELGVIHQVCDVTDESDVRALVDRAVDDLGGLDVLVNNAGLGGTQDVATMTDEQWSRVLDVTLTGTFRMTRAALQVMQPQGHGAIVNNASVVGWRAEAGQAHYGAAKAGVMAFTRCAAMDAAPFGVRINAVAPSLAMHPFLAKVSDQAYLDGLAAAEPFGRAAEPWEIANVMVFLASDYSAYMTGEVLSVSSQHP